MIVTANQIKEELTELWPEIIIRWLSDKKYIAPSVDELVLKVNNFSVSGFRVIDNICECEDLSDMLWFRIKGDRIKRAQNGSFTGDELHNWAFGVAFGNKFKGWRSRHTLNICYTEEGIVLIEPQTDEIWHPKPGDSDVLAVHM